MDALGRCEHVRVDHDPVLGLLNQPGNLGSLARGDLGPSFKYPNRTVNEIIADKLPVTVKLTRKPTGDTFEFGGRISVGQKVTDVTSTDNSDLSEAATLHGPVHPAR